MDESKVYGSKVTVLTHVYVPLNVDGRIKSYFASSTYRPFIAERSSAHLYINDNRRNVISLQTASAKPHL